MRRCRVLLLLFLLPFVSQAGDGDYAVSRIPAALLANAHVVKRMEKIEVVVNSLSEMTIHTRYALTILDANGDDAATFAGYYDALHQVKNIEGTLYDADGLELKKLKNRQIFDISATSDGDLATDSRKKMHNFNYHLYPFTVQYEVEEKIEGTFLFPAWTPREQPYYSVEESSFSITTPITYQFRYKTFHYPGEPVVTTSKNERTSLWSVSAIPATHYLYGSPSWEETNVTVLTGPTEFELQHYRGNMSSWKEFGMFIATLNAGRDELPDETRQAVAKIVAEHGTVRERIDALYRYMQRTTRYVNIRLGIGGWQPFQAAFVATKGYGDCKALANYMKSLLAAANIPSFYTLVNAGPDAEAMITDFPSQQFNHAILCVPLTTDTIWLECTSQTVSPGYMGAFTSDRDALVILPDGGKVVHIPAYSGGQNHISHFVEATLNEAGDLSFTATDRYSGVEQDDLHEMLHQYSKEDIGKWLHERFDLGTYEIHSFDYNSEEQGLPSVVEKLSVGVTNYATVTGRRLFITPNLIGRLSSRPSPDSLRTDDILIRFARSYDDTVYIQVPSDYQSESIPAAQQISTRFGTYTTRTELKDHRIMYLRHFEMSNGKFPASGFNELAKFLTTVYQSDRARVVLVRQ